MAQGDCAVAHAARLTSSDGKRFAYLAAMTLDVRLPPSTGIAPGEVLLDFLRWQRFANNPAR